MRFNKKNVEPFKGKVVELNYICTRKEKGKLVKYKPNINGVISLTTDSNFHFKPSDEELEIPLKYSQITSIEVLKRIRHQTT